MKKSIKKEKLKQKIENSEQEEAIDSAEVNSALSLIDSSPLISSLGQTPLSIAETQKFASSVAEDSLRLNNIMNGVSENLSQNIAGVGHLAEDAVLNMKNSASVLNANQALSTLSSNIGTLTENNPLLNANLHPTGLTDLSLSKEMEALSIAPVNQYAGLSNLSDLYGQESKYLYTAESLYSDLDKVVESKPAVVIDEKEQIVNEITKIITAKVPDTKEIVEAVVEKLTKNFGWAFKTKPKIKGYELSFDSELSAIKFAGKEIPIPKNTNQEQLCKVVFASRENCKKEWSWDEMLEEWSEEPLKEYKMKVYHAGRDINSLVATKTMMLDLFVVNTNTIRLNPKYLDK